MFASLSVQNVHLLVLLMCVLFRSTFSFVLAVFCVAHCVRFVIHFPLVCFLDIITRCPIEFLHRYAAGQVTAVLMEAFLKRHYPGVRVVRVHSDTNIFRYCCILAVCCCCCCCCSFW